MKRSLLMLSCIPLLMRAPGGEKETSETSGVTGTNAVTLSGMFAESRNLSTDAGAPYDPAADENLVPVEGKNGQTVYVSPESAEHILNKRLEREVSWESRSVGNYGNYGRLDDALAPEVPAAPAPEPTPDPKSASKIDAPAPPTADPVHPAPVAEGELKPLAPEGAVTEPATKTNKPAKPAK